MNLKEYLAGVDPPTTIKGKPSFRCVVKTFLFFRKPLLTGHFMNIELLLKRNDLLSICQMVIGGDSDKYTIFDSGYVIGCYNHLSKNKLNYTYIYGGEILTLKPPVISKDPDWNAPLRDRFINDYGDLMELVYLICQGDMLKQKQVAKLPFEEFLMLGQYLLRKKAIES
jgi:hypothetical protein